MPRFLTLLAQHLAKNKLLCIRMHAARALFVFAFSMGHGMTMHVSLLQHASSNFAFLSHFLCLLLLIMERWLEHSVPLHVLFNFASAKAEGNQEEVENTLRWLPTGQRVALLEALSASLQGDTASFTSAAPSADPAAADPSFASASASAADPPVEPASFATADATDNPKEAPSATLHEVPDLSEGGHPKYSHLLSYDGFMDYSYDDWYVHWESRNFLEAMVDGASPLMKPAEASASSAPDPSFAAPDPSFSAGIPQDAPDIPFKKGGKKGVTEDPPPKARVSFAGDGGQDAQASSFTDPPLPPLDPAKFRLAPEVMYQYGPFQVALCHRLECREFCIDCASGHCGATLDPTKPETLSHRHRCRFCYRAFRMKQWKDSTFQ